jgi:hypothetical protein
MSLITVIGRGHSGTRAISHTLAESGVYMGARCNVSGDLIPPDELYEACRVMARHVVHRGGLEWDFSALHTAPIDPAFVRLVESYLDSVLISDAPRRGWKLPETTLIYPWIVRLFPDAYYIQWIRDPRDSILGGHLTDDLADFGIPYNRTDDVQEMRAVSWKYQREIVKATPPPERVTTVRFEDFVLRQEQTLAGLEEFLGFPLARISVRPEAVGRWKHSETSTDLEIFHEDLVEQGYLS